MKPLLLALSVAPLLTLSLTQCSPSSEPPDRSRDEASAADGHRGGSGGANALTVFTWDGYVDPEVLADFSDRTGISVAVESFEDSDEIEATLRSDPGRHDLIIVDQNVIDRLRELQLLAPLDHSALSRLGNLDPEYTDLEFDRGNRFSVPYLWGTTLIAYRRDKIPSPSPSWDLLWNPKYRGRIAMIEEREEAIGAALLKNGFSINERGEQPLARAKADLLRQVSEFRVQYIEGTPAALQTALSDDIWAAMAYSGDAVMVAEEDENIGYFTPHEGCAIWMDSLVIARDSRHQDAAHRLINFLLEGKTAAKNANSLCYATPNKAALPHLDPELRANPGVFPPPSVLKRCEFAGKLTDQRERPMNHVWREVIGLYEKQDSTAVENGIAETPVKTSMHAPE